MKNNSLKTVFLLLAIMGAPVLLTGCDFRKAPEEPATQPQYRAAPAPGLSRSELIKQYGSPKGVMSNGTMEVLLYDEGSVSLTSNRVTKVDWRNSEEMLRLETYRSEPQLANQQLTAERLSRLRAELQNQRSELAGLEKERQSLIRRSSSLQRSYDNDQRDMDYHKTRSRQHPGWSSPENRHSNYHERWYHDYKSDANETLFDINKIDNELPLIDARIERLKKYIQENERILSRSQR